MSETAKIIYCILLNRARLSQKNEGFTDEQGRIFIYYPIKDLAETIRKSEMSVKTALSVLEENRLIFRKRQGVGKANRIYVKFPEDTNPSAKQTENDLSGGKKTICQVERNPSGSNKDKKNKDSVNRKSKAYGKYQNVFLSDAELTTVRQAVPNYLEYIGRLSEYMQSTGKHYADHAATIRRWYLKDNPTQIKREYIRKESESL